MIASVAGVAGVAVVVSCGGVVWLLLPNVFHHACSAAASLSCFRRCGPLLACCGDAEAPCQLVSAALA